jgi:hypothetical protein
MVIGDLPVETAQSFHGKCSGLEADPRAVQHDIVMQRSLPERQNVAVDRHMPMHDVL